MIVKISDLQPNMMVVYKINYKNGKIYIGSTIDLKRRMQEHLSLNKNKKRQVCDYAIMSQGGLEDVEIIEFINDINALEPREDYWIDYYNATDRTVGYNILSKDKKAFGSDDTNIRSVFTNEQVLDIRKRRFLGERKKDVYKDYSTISFATFERVWLGRGYSNVGQEYIIPSNTKSRQEYSSIANTGIRNGRAKCSVEDVKNIRQDFQDGLNYNELHNKYNFLSISTIKRIVKYQVYKEIE